MAQLAAPHLGNQQSAQESEVARLKSKRNSKDGNCFAIATVATSLIWSSSSDKELKPTNTGNGEHKKRGTPAFTGAPLFVWGGGNLWLRLRLGLRLRLRVVLLVVDVLRRAVLFLVDLLLFGSR